MLGQMSTPRPATRSEQDLLGSRDVLAAARYGVHTSRAIENFPLIDQRVADVPEFARALGMVKLAALRANVDCSVIEEPTASALERACAELADDEEGLRSALVLPIIQGGAGTSTNMNVNEVLANRALELMGRTAGDYAHCHPNDHVNRSQSTNDVYPTALRLALVLRHAAVRAAWTALVAGLREQAGRHAATPKLGRTQLQDAVPMTVGEEFHAWADLCASAIGQTDQATTALLEVNLGGTAIGTGITAPEGYRELAVGHLRDVSGLPVSSAGRLVSGTTDPGALLAYSAGMRSAAVALVKLADDLRLLSSGPRAGLAELRLPARQAGSSLMPGKVNPVVPEYVDQLAYDVQGRDLTVVHALSAGQLQLNAMLPVATQALFRAQDALRVAAATLDRRCIRGLVVDEERDRALSAMGLGDATERAAHDGHDAMDRRVGVRS